MKLKTQKTISLFTLACAGLTAPLHAATIDVTSHISGNVTWETGNEYILYGRIYVLDGASLTIQKGTVIKGEEGQDANASALIVTRGAKIFANGTEDQPIIFTSVLDDVADPEDLPLFQRGLWGGVVLLGKATLNTTVDPTGNNSTPKYELFEGLPDQQINGQFVNRFGGNDDNDSSGVFRYVSIRHGGIVFQPNKELNGLSLGAVGRGTTVEHVETFATADDGFEFFGGTVNTKYLISAFNDDDAFDTDQGFRGKNQFWFVIQEPGKKDNGGELNGEPSGVAVGVAPAANYEIYNATWIGAGAGSSGNRGMIIREYAAPKFYNSIFTDFGGKAISIDDKSAAHLNSGLLDIRDNIFWGFATPLAETAAAEILFTDAARNNLNINPMLRGISRAQDGGLDPRPQTGSPAETSTRTAPNDGFYTPVAYKGAFNQVNWARWTWLAQSGILTMDTAAPDPVQPDVAAQISGNQLAISFASEAGVNYQVQTSSNLETWNGGQSQQGTGESMTFNVAMDQPWQFFRVKAE